MLLGSLPADATGACRGPRGRQIQELDCHRAHAIPIGGKLEGICGKSLRSSTKSTATGL